MGADKERFTTELPDHLLCEICLNVSYPPLVVCAKEHTACEACVSRLKRDPSTKGKCPLCPLPMVRKLRRSLVLQRAIDTYKYTCRLDGCAWTGALADEEGHADECDYRQAQCRRCEAEFLFKDRTEHRGICPEALLRCPTGGQDCKGTEGGRFKRRDVKAHLDNDCAQWKCTAVAGCKTRTTLANRASHESACKASANTIKALKKAIAKQIVEIQSLEAALAKEKAKVDPEEPAKQGTSAKEKPKGDKSNVAHVAAKPLVHTVPAAATATKNEADAAGGSTNSTSSPTRISRRLTRRSPSVSPALPDAKKPRLSAGEAT